MDAFIVTLGRLTEEPAQHGPQDGNQSPQEQQSACTQATSGNQNAGGSLAMSNFYQAVLDCFPDAACKQEIRRFFALDEIKTVTQFRKSELLKVLCAAFRLNPQKAFAQPDNKLSLDELRELVPSDRRLDAESATNFNVFWWGGVTDGFLPDGFADNLARLDALEAEVSDDESDRASTRPTFLFHNRTPSNTVRPASCLPTSRPIRLIMIII